MAICSKTIQLHQMNKIKYNIPQNFTGQFDAQFYKKNSDISISNKRLLIQHFVNIGHKENKNISILVDTKFVKSILQVDGNPVQNFLNFFSKNQNKPFFFLNPAIDWYWIESQLQTKNIPISQLLEAVITVPTFSSSPFLKKEEIKPNTKLKNFLETSLSQEKNIELLEYLRKNLARSILDIETTNIPPKDIYIKILRTFSSVIFEKNISIDGSSLRNGIKKINARDWISLIEALISSVLGNEKEYVSFNKTSALHNDIFNSDIELDKIILQSPKIKKTKLFVTQEEIQKNTQNYIKNDTVIYKCVLGNYDTVEPPIKKDKYDFVIFTDIENYHDGWLNVISSKTEKNLKRKCLWYKTHPHYFFQNSEFSLWLDGNVSICEDGLKIIESHKLFSEISSFKHWGRDCMFDEAAEIFTLELDKPQNINFAINSANNAKLPANWGLWETNALFINLKDELVKKALERWWQLIYLGSERDQLSFSTSLFEVGLRANHLLGEKNARTNQKCFIYKPHNKVR